MQRSRCRSSRGGASAFHVSGNRLAISVLNEEPEQTVVVPAQTGRIFQLRRSQGLALASIRQRGFHGLNLEKETSSGSSARPHDRLKGI